MAQNNVTIDVEARFIDNVTAAAKKAGKAVDDLGKKSTKIVLDLDDDDARKDVKQTSKELDNLGKKHPKPSIGVNDNATKLLDKIEMKTKKLADKVCTMAVKIRDNEALKELAALENKAQNLAKKTWTAVVKIKDVATAPLRAIEKKLFSLKTLAAGVIGGLVVGKIGNIASGAVNTYAGREDMTTQFKVLLGSQKAAKERVQQLTDFAAQTPFTRDEIFAASKILQTYTQGALATPDSTGGLKKVGDIASATGAEYNQVATYMGRLYNEVQRGGQSIGEPLAFLREMGALSAEQEKKIREIATGSGDIKTKWEAIDGQFKNMDGMMEEMSLNTNNLLLGVKALKTNYWNMPIGEGIMESFKPFLQRFQKWRGENKDAMQAWYDGVKKVASVASDKVLGVFERIGKRAYKVMDSEEFQNADIFGKISMLWKGAIGNPFADWWSHTVVPWWNSTAIPWLAEKANGMGELIGSGLSGGLLALFGVPAADIAGEGASVAANFVQGFTEGFDASAVADALISAIGDVWSALPAWAKMLLGVVGVGKAAGAVGNLAGSVANIKTLLYGAPVAAAGTAGAAGAAGAAEAGAAATTGGLIAKAGAAKAGLVTGLGKVATGLGASSALSAGKLALLGGGSIAGGLAAGATVISAGNDLYKGGRDENLNAGSGTMGRAYTKSGVSKLAGVGAGAAAGAAIGSVIPVLGTAAGALIGAGIGGIAGWLKGNKIKKEAAEGITSLKELEQAAQSSSDAAEALEKRQTAMANAQKSLFGSMKMSNTEILDFMEGTLGKSSEQLDIFKKATNIAKASRSTFTQLGSSLEMLDWKAKNGFKFDETDIQEYKSTVDDYLETAKKLLSNTQTEGVSAIDALYGADSDAGSKRKEQLTSMFTDMEKELESASKGLSKAYSDALADGIINADEQKAIDAAREKMNNITSKLNDADRMASSAAMQIKFGNAELDSESYQALEDEIGTWLSDQKVSLDEALQVELKNLALDGELTDDEIAQAQAAYEDGLSGMVLEARDTRIKILMDQTGIQEALGTDAEGVKKDINSILDYALNNGIDPVEITPDIAVKITGNEEFSKMDQGTFDAIFKPIQSMYNQAMEFDVNAKANAKVDFSAASQTLTTALDSMKTEFSGPHDFPVHVNAKVKTTVSGNTSINIGGGTTISVPVSAGNRARGGLVGLDIPAYAEGGMVAGGAQLVTVAEEGSPEMIIPLSGQRRARGMQLWSKAGQMMGVPGFANGGLVGDDEGIRNQQYGGGEAAGGSQGVQVDVGGVTVEIQVNGNESGNMVEAIRNQGAEIAETVAGILADAFAGQFANTPAKGGA